ncbi:hypothetical protein Glove_37g130 [Diversispora epigaea]|uniref:HMG box domain-containing protein n=1 Tax=Diversispora epigaea TaxID=1348612 RepID=A0A397JQ94_9GLOM|nr:hypothetical protein Glove_37g130 [Diversispora epigaea]
MNDVKEILSNINRTILYTPPPTVFLFHSQRSFRGHKNCHGYMLFKISVDRECRRLGFNNEMKISYAASYLWKNSTSQEKSLYKDLAQRNIRFIYRERMGMLRFMVKNYNNYGFTII